MLHSGECNWRFKFKLIGIERLDVLFNEVLHRVATNNKNTEPRNVTLKLSKVAPAKQRVKRTAHLAETAEETKSEQPVIDLGMTASVVTASSPDKDKNRSFLGAILKPFEIAPKKAGDEEQWVGAGIEVPAILKQTMRIATAEHEKEEETK